MAWSLVELFQRGFQVVAERVAGEGGTIADLRQRFIQRFPGQPVPHANTLNALFNRAKVSADIAGRINRGVKPRAGSYPQVPRGFDCSGFVYNIVVDVDRPVFGQRGRRETVGVPVQVQTDAPVDFDELRGLGRQGLDELLGSGSTYELLAFGVAQNRFRVTGYRVTSAYRC